MAYGTRGLNDLSSAQSTQLLIPVSLRSIIIFSSHLHLGLPQGFLPVGLHVKTLKAYIYMCVCVHASNEKFFKYILNFNYLQLGYIL